MNYYYSTDGTEVQGPYSLADLTDYFTSGALSAATQVCAEGSQEWQTLDSLMELMPRTSPRPFSAPQPRRPSPVSQQQVLSPTQSGPAKAVSSNVGPVLTGVPPASGLAVASLVLGLCSLLVFITCVPAVICGHMALSKIKKAAGQVGGRGLAIAGLVIGYVFIGTAGTFGLVAAIMVYSSHSAQESSKANLERAFAQQVVRAIKDYADENNNTTPPTLQALVPLYVPDQSVLTTRLGGVSLYNYDYLVPSVSGSTLDPHTAILRDRRQTRGDRRLYVYADGSFAEK